MIPRYVFFAVFINHLLDYYLYVVPQIEYRKDLMHRDYVKYAIVVNSLNSYPGLFVIEMYNKYNYPN